MYPALKVIGGHVLMCIVCMELDLSHEQQRDMAS